MRERECVYGNHEQRHRIYAKRRIALDGRDRRAAQCAGYSMRALIYDLLHGKWKWDDLKVNEWWRDVVGHRIRYGRLNRYCLSDHVNVLCQCIRRGYLRVDKWRNDLVEYRRWVI